MKVVSPKEFFEVEENSNGACRCHLEPGTPDAIRAAIANYPTATHLAKFVNQALDASACGQTTFVLVGPDCTYKTPDAVDGHWLNDLPSQRQYPVACVEITPDLFDWVEKCSFQ